MTRTHILPTLALLLGGALVLSAADDKTDKEKKSTRVAPTYRFSGPFTHDNLTIFLIHGDDELKNKNILTLDEALEQKKVIVHETKNVNELSIENISDAEIFVQAGDIVKGGQQDRLIGFDMLLKPKSGRLPVASFCVEASRWNKRGGEDVAQFGSSKEYGCANDLRLAARKGMSQDGVWKEVAKTQEGLKKNIGAEVKAKESTTSLQLTMEHKKVKEAIEAHLKKLSGCMGDKKDVIGYAVVINGKVINVDVYGSHDLFKKLWPKLVKATAIEAVTELKKDKKFESGKLDQVKAFLADIESGKATSKDIGKRIQQFELETKKGILFESNDKDQKGLTLRRSYLAY